MSKKWLFFIVIIILFLLIITLCQLTPNSKKPFNSIGSNNSSDLDNSAEYSISSNSQSSAVSYNSNETSSSSVSSILSTTITMGDTSINTYGYGICSDLNGNSFVTGNTLGNIDGQAKTGTCDGFVIKYNFSGIKLWTRILGTADAYTYGAGISSDINGNCYLTGYTSGNLNSQTITGKNDLFIVKYNSSGNILWTKLLGAADAYTYGAGISSDINGNCYLTGYTTGNLDGQIKTGKNDLFIVKYDSSGNKLWTRLLGAADSFAWGTGISVDLKGNSYITGYTTGNLDGQKLTGSMDLAVIKYDTSGNKLWVRLSGVNNKSTSGRGITVETNGSCYVTGNTTGNLDGQKLTGSMDLFVAKYNSNGNRLWTELLGIPNAETFGYGIIVDLKGSSYITGRTSGNLDGQKQAGAQDIFIIKYNSSGNKQYTKLFGFKGLTSWGTGISINSKGSGCVSGYITGDIQGQIKSGSKYIFIITSLNN